MRSSIAIAPENCWQYPARSRSRKSASGVRLAARRLAVAELVAGEMALDRADVVVGGVGAGAQAARERVDGPVRRRLQRRRRVDPAGADDHRRAPVAPPGKDDGGIAAAARAHARRGGRRAAQRQAQDAVLERHGQVIAAGAAHAGGRRPRRVDARAVGVAAAQRLADGLEDAGGDARRGPRGRDDAACRARRHELRRAQRPQRDADRLDPGLVEDEPLEPSGACPVSCTQRLPSKATRLTAFQYARCRAWMRSTSRPSRGQSSGP